MGSHNLPSPDPSARVPLVAFDPTTAKAVVTVLRGSGIAAWAHPENGDCEVRVKAADRDRALQVLSWGMEDVRASVARDREQDQPAEVPADPDDVRSGPPLVLERFRSMSWLLAVVLAPVMMITLATVPIPRSVAIAGIVVAGTIIAGLVLRRR